MLILKNILGTKLNNNNPKTKIIYLQGLKKLYITLCRLNIKNNIFNETKNKLFKRKMGR
jgi:hypothetical protein